MRQVFPDDWLSQELASVGQLDLGVCQLYDGDKVEARRLVPLTWTDYAFYDSSLIAVSAERKSRKERRRVEKPLLRKVLHPTGLKAYGGRKTLTKDSAPKPAIMDVVSDDGVTKPSCDPIPDGFPDGFPDDYPDDLIPNPIPY